jgi:hypothetical protein
MNHAGEFPDIYLYTAIPGTECGGPGTAQNVFATPEPVSLFLLGSGVLGLAGIIRRKFHC